VKKPKDLLTGRRYLLDLSAIPVLPDIRDDLPVGFLIVSESMNRALTSAPTEELLRLLASVTVSDEEVGFELSPVGLTSDTLPSVFAAYQHLKQVGVITVIPDEEADSPALRAAISEIAKVGRAPIVARLTDGRPVTSHGLVKRHLSTILSYSKRTGTAIISRGRTLVSRVTRAIATLELPQKAGRLVQQKQAFGEKLFAKPGRRAGKFFVGALIAVGGLVNPAIGAAGAVLYFVDP
jgi:hypothetical protein